MNITVSYGVSCYISTYSINTNGVYNRKDMKEAVKRALDQWSGQENEGRGIAQFSITEQDKEWKKWLQVFKEFPGTVILPTKTKCHLGSYKCYAILVPISYDSKDVHQGQWV